MYKRQVFTQIVVVTLPGMSVLLLKPLLVLVLGLFDPVLDGILDEPQSVQEALLPLLVPLGRALGEGGLGMLVNLAVAAGIKKSET